MRILRILFLCLVLSAAAWAQQPKAGRILHKVTPGETLGILSRIYGVSPEDLREENDWKRVQECKTFWIPANPKHWATHEVREGDTLLLLSQGYQIPIQQLRDANANPGGPLTPGTILYLPRTQKPEWSAPPTETVAIETAATETVTPEPRRKSLEGSRGAKSIRIQPTRPPRTASGEWVAVTTLDGRKGWTQTSELSFSPPKAPKKPTPLVPTLSFGKKLDIEQKKAIQAISDKLAEDGLKVKADDIAIFMALETGGTFDPATRPKNHPGHAVGLAQFTQIAITDLNRRRAPQQQLTMSKLASMTFAQQSEVVAEYLSVTLQRKNMVGKAVSCEDLYSAIFCPRAVGKSSKFVVYSQAKDSGPYYRNRSLDQNRDGAITKQEMTSRLNRWKLQGESSRG